MTTLRKLGLKLFSVALAAGLWLAVSGEPIAERGMRIPVAFENVPESMEILGNPPESVEVRLRGPSGDVAAPRSGRHGRNHRSRLGACRDEDVRHELRSRAPPLGIDVTQVIPSTISLTLDVSASRVVPIVPEVRGAPAAGFMVGAVEVEPASVEVEGPASRLHDLVEAMTEPIDVTGMSVPMRRMVTVGVDDPYLRLVTPGSARVTIPIVRAPGGGGAARTAAGAARTGWGARD